MTNKNKSGFTLAEVLITLAIIGVVAALTIPNLLANFQSKQFDSGDKVFYNKLNEALRIMNTQQVLAGHGTTEKFVTELQKHLKIAKVCSDTPTDCFADTVTWGDAGDADITKIKLSKDLATEDYGTNVVGIQFANGMSALLAYNPKCNPDPYSNQANVMECVAVLYDTNANSTPNTLAQDVRKTANVKELKKNEICTSDGVCVIKTAFQPEAIDGDYWFGAKQACEDVGGRLPTLNELISIAEEIYNSSTSMYGAAFAVPIDYMVEGRLNLKNPYEIAEDDFWLEDNANVSPYSYSEVGLFDLRGFYYGFNGESHNTPRVKALCVK